MPTKEPPKRQVAQGPTGDVVRRNVARIRKESRITSERLVQVMAEYGHAMPRTAISEIENGGRRVTVDDLMALSIALNVNPSALLLPNYAGDADVSYEATGMPEGTTGADLWAWSDGWRALPHERREAPDVDADASGMERGRQIYDQRAVEQGRGFLERIRPDGESAGTRSFLADIAEKLSELKSRDWLSVWFHSNDPQRFDVDRDGPIGARVVGYPEGGWRDISKYYERIKSELAGILGSETARPFINEVLAKRAKGHGNG